MNPEVAAVPFLDRPRPAAFAHRGGSAHAPENTWRAFEYAVKLGYAYLETDARATADGQLMAFHDRTVDRVTDGSGPIGSLRYADLTTSRRRPRRLEWKLPPRCSGLLWKNPSFQNR